MTLLDRFRSWRNREVGVDEHDALLYIISEAEIEIETEIGVDLTL
jgi:hypothetical protein